MIASNDVMEIPPGFSLLLGTRNGVSNGARDCASAHAQAQVPAPKFFASPLPVSAKSSSKIFCIRLGLSVPTTEPAFIE